MKKAKIPLLIIFIAALAICLWFYGYYNHKDPDNIPSKAAMASYCLEKGEDYASGKLRGYERGQLIEVWGEPDFGFFGVRGDIWDANDAYCIAVFYDSKAVVETVKIMDAPAS